MMDKPSDIPDAEVNTAAEEADIIGAALDEALGRLTIQDPDALTSALALQLIEAHAKSGNNTPAGIMGAFALCVTEWALHDQNIDIDAMPGLAAQMLDFVASKLRG